MNTDDLNRAWKSPANCPSPEAAARERAAFVQRLQREHRSFRFWVIRAFSILAVITVGLGVFVADGGAFDVRREWAVLLLLALPWMAAILFVRRQVRHRRAHPDYEQSVAHSVRALLDANRAAQQRSRLLIGLFGLMVPVLAGCIWQLQRVGKARPHEAASLAIFMAVVVALSALGVYWRSRRLRPEEKRLSELAADFA